MASLTALCHQHGFFIRNPKSRFQNVLILFFRDYQWARRLLGGVWEGYIHDIGTCRACITWHWVEAPSKDLKSHPLYRIEKYEKGRSVWITAG